jgi:hypothetical protein
MCYRTRPGVEDVNPGKLKLQARLYKNQGSPTNIVFQISSILHVITCSFLGQVDMFGYGISGFQESVEI